MIDLLTNMINRADDNGLILFDAPTGLGKTTAAVKYIKNYLDHRESFPQQRITKDNEVIEMTPFIRTFSEQGEKGIKNIDRLRKS